MQLFNKVANSLTPAKEKRSHSKNTSVKMEKADISFHAPGTAASGTTWPSAVQLLYLSLCFKPMLLGAGKQLRFSICINLVSFLKTD